MVGEFDISTVSPLSLSPRENPTLLGHEPAALVLLNAWRSGRLHHAWLLSGPRGIGKATLSFRFARFALAGGPTGESSDSLFYIAPDNPVFRRVASGGHADLLTLERGTNEKTGKPRSEIIIDDVRRVGRLVSLTPGEGQWRVVIIDGAEDMNRNAANAILKHLEEPPPQTLFLLVSHAPASLLPTVRSRCRALTLRPLSDGILNCLIAKRLAPELNAEERDLLVALSDGSPGRATALVEQGGVVLFKMLLDILEHLPDLDTQAVHSLGDKVARKDGADTFRTLADLLLWWLNYLICDGAKSEPSRAISEREVLLRQRLLAKGDLEHWARVWEKLNHLFARAEAVNLEPKQVVLSAFSALQQAAAD